MPELNEAYIREHDQVAGTHRVTLFPASAKRLIDEASSTLTYVGVAAPGTATSTEKAWLIEKISVSGSVTTITHATDKAWDDRATATYS